MNNLLLRRRALMRIGGEDNDYIKDGLVFWLDGTDATSTNWIDRIGGLNFAMQNIAFAENGGVVFNGSSSQGTAEGHYTAPVSESTIELVMKSTDAGGMVIFPHKSNTICCGINKSKLITSNVNAIWCQTIPIQLNSDIVVSVQNIDNQLSYGFLNTEPIVFGDNNYWGDDVDAYTSLGYRITSNRLWFSGTIYQIRVYNRHLTDKEMLHNQSIDMKRYNII